MWYDSVRLSGEAGFAQNLLFNMQLVSKLKYVKLTMPFDVANIPN